MEMNIMEGGGGVFKIFSGLHDKIKSNSSS